MEFSCQPPNNRVSPARGFDAATRIFNQAPANEFGATGADAGFGLGWNPRIKPPILLLKALVVHWPTARYKSPHDVVLFYSNLDNRFRSLAARLGVGVSCVCFDWFHNLNPPRLVFRLFRPSPRQWQARGKGLMLLLFAVPVRPKIGRSKQDAAKGHKTLLGGLGQVV